jgi:transposase
MRIEFLLRCRPGGHGGVAADKCLFVNAVWFVAKTGNQWRDLSKSFGKWDTAYKAIIVMDRILGTKRRACPRARNPRPCSTSNGLHKYYLKLLHAKHSPPYERINRRSVFPGAWRASVSSTAVVVPKSA